VVSGQHTDENRLCCNAISIVEWDDRSHWDCVAVKGPTGANLGLYAFDAENISTVLYQPSGCPTRDAIGPVRFSVPTIANGYVFVGTQTDFDILGTSPGTCK
jgi:hypothetical protein